MHRGLPGPGPVLVDWVRPLLNYAYQRVTGTGRYLGGPRALHRCAGRAAPRPAGLARGCASMRSAIPDGTVALLKLRDRWTVVLQVLRLELRPGRPASQERRVASWGPCSRSAGRRAPASPGCSGWSGPSPTRVAASWSGGRGLAGPRRRTRRPTSELIERAGPTATRHETLPRGQLRRSPHPAAGPSGGRGPGGRGEGRARRAGLDPSGTRASRPRGTSASSAPEHLARLCAPSTTPPPSSPRTPPVVDPATARRSRPARWPAKSEWSRYRTDSGLHAVYWIAEWPSIPVEAAWCYPLLALSGVRRTVSVSAVPDPPVEVAAGDAQPAGRQARRRGPAPSPRADRDRPGRRGVPDSWNAASASWSAATPSTASPAGSPSPRTTRRAARRRLRPGRAGGGAQRARAPAGLRRGRPGLPVAALPLNEGVRSMNRTRRHQLEPSPR